MGVPEIPNSCCLLVQVTATKKKLLLVGLRFKLLLYSSTVAENTAVFLIVEGRKGCYVFLSSIVINLSFISIVED
jgi:hypothetical protein